MRPVMKIEDYDCSVCGERSRVATGEVAAGEENVEFHVCAPCAQAIMCRLRSDRRTGPGGTMVDGTGRGFLVEGAEVHDRECDVVTWRSGDRVVVARTSLMFRRAEEAVAAAKLLCAAVARPTELDFSESR